MYVCCCVCVRACVYVSACVACVCDFREGSGWSLLVAWDGGGTSWSHSCPCSTSSS
uniref:Secreted protein n=1 Tax=Anguilla anguilla TaxID=7936 RepID=A0A0E9SQQ8_ANGAN